MTAHAVTSVDTIVRGHPGTVSTCTCGWRSAWGVRDGSAESDAHGHVMAVDPVARAAHEERMRVWREEQDARREADRKATAERAAAHAVAQPRAEHFHNCSCHISAPCGACVNCAHMAGDIDCPNDCQECNGHEGES